MKLGRVWIVVAGCVYELAALIPGSPLPTITHICHRLREHPAGRFVLWLGFGYLIDHIFHEAP